MTDTHPYQRPTVSHWRTCAVCGQGANAAVHRPAPYRRRQPMRSTAAYLAMCARMIGAAGARVAEGDPEELAALAALRGAVEAAVEVGVIGQRRSGITWDSIGAATGTTRQAAYQKWSAAAIAAGTRRFDPGE